ncbi:MAG: hypothetical protein HY925_15020 [Elusimicrobia bacterium]|nr:hypothetical protein [Elusimicrobiota bacterium]
MILALVLLAGCRSTQPEVRVGPGADLTRYRRIGILPFSEPHGKGGKAAELVEQAFRGMGFGTVSPSQMGPVFDSLRVERGAELGLEQLMTLRQATQAEALVFGSTAPVKKGGKPRFSILVIDGQSGDLVAKGERDVLSDERGGLEATVDAVMDAIRDKLLSERKEPMMEKLEDP